jgi:mycothiol system anti-sigma-R factor
MIKCDEVLKRLYDYIDKELDEELRTEIEEHLKLCKYCSHHRDFEIQLKELIQKSCWANGAPEFLRTKISDMLKEF